MQADTGRPTALILQFAAHPLHPNRLTVADRIEAMRWHEANAVPLGARLAIFPRQPEDGPEIGDYIAIYRADDRWAVWGAARTGGSITLWHGPTGADRGSYPSMADALAAVCVATIEPRTAAPVRARRRV